MNQPIDRMPTRPERGDVAHVSDAGDERREDKRRNDHLDQAQEERCDDAEIVGDGLERRGARRSAVVDRSVDRPTGNDAEHQREQDEPCESFRHAFPSVARTQAVGSNGVKLHSG